MADKPEQPKEEEDTPQLVERPLECSECKKPVEILYTQVVGEHLLRTCHCADCPVMKRHLFGAPQIKPGGSQVEGSKVLCCGNCGTNLEAVLMGALLGCSQCYELFAETIVHELTSTNKVPSRIIVNKKSVPLHVGRSLGEVTELSPSLRLLALNDALSETLQREDYEQAAWLRDQIRELERPNEEKK